MPAKMGNKKELQENGAAGVDQPDSNLADTDVVVIDHHSHDDNLADVTAPEQLDAAPAQQSATELKKGRLRGWRRRKGRSGEAEPDDDADKPTQIDVSDDAKREEQPAALRDLFVFADKLDWLLVSVGCVRSFSALRTLMFATAPAVTVP